MVAVVVWQALQYDRNNNMAVITISNKKQPSCKKRSAALEKAMVKKYVKSKVAAKNGCDGRLMVKILITTIQVNLVPLGQLAQNLPELSLLKFLPLTYHHSHFWPPPWISHLFSP